MVHTIDLNHFTIPQSEDLCRITASPLESSSHRLVAWPIVIRLSGRGRSHRRQRGRGGGRVLGITVRPSRAVPRRDNHRDIGDVLTADSSPQERRAAPEWTRTTSHRTRSQTKLDRARDH